MIRRAKSGFHGRLCSKAGRLKRHARKISASLVVVVPVVVTAAGAVEIAVEIAAGTAAVIEVEMIAIAADATRS